MKLENIRPNFSFASEEEKRTMFWNYCDKRAKDFERGAMVTVKTKKAKGSSASSSSPKLKVTDAQLAMLKMLNLV